MMAEMKAGAKRKEAAKLKEQVGAYRRGTWACAPGGGVGWMYGLEERDITVGGSWGWGRRAGS